LLNVKLAGIGLKVVKIWLSGLSELPIIHTSG